jgi:hypothetical protein
VPGALDYATSNERHTQVAGHLDDALTIVAELGPPDDLRPAVLLAAAFLLARPVPASPEGDAERVLRLLRDYPPA